MTTPSGPAWCDQFPSSALTDNLAQPFRGRVEAFLDALRAAGARVTISTTFRPPERAYLMHWSWQIAHGLTVPGDVPPMDGVEIDWTHGGDLAAAVDAARQMVHVYNIVRQPSLRSHHTEGRAIDMTVSWRGAVQVCDARGVQHWCVEQAHLWPIGASYGVHKLPSDSPHWSDDGH